MAIKSGTAEIGHQSKTDRTKQLDVAARGGLFNQADKYWLEMLW